MLSPRNMSIVESISNSIVHSQNPSEQKPQKTHFQKMSLISDEVNKVVNDFFKDKVSVLKSRVEPATYDC